MYQQFRNSRPWHNQGNQNRNGFRRPFNPGRFNRSSNPRHQSKLGRDVNLFIKKAQEILPAERYTSTHSFADFEIMGILKQNIENRGYTQPTPIQDQAIEPILQGRDLIGLANTGTGKTAAFLIPLINKICKNRNNRVLIVTPTRELALQINEEIRNFSQNLSVSSTVVIGGTNMNRQIQSLRRNPNFVIATPGRLKDLIQRKVLSLDSFSTFVLDEVDLMVDIGFIHEIKYFISLLPSQRQSLFFSATIPPKVREILEPFVHNPVTVSVKKQETPENIDQDIVKVTDVSKKVDLLHDLLIQEGFEKVLVFGRTKHGLEKLNKHLLTRGFKVGAIHGNKTQNHRQRVLESFKRSEIQVLLATDVAARGLDIENVTHVINYDLPETYEDYIHRIGRTGRANQKGKALTFVE